MKRITLIFLLLLLLTAVGCSAEDEILEIEEVEQPDNVEISEKEEMNQSADITDSDSEIDADYMIDIQSGSIKLSELKIGDRVADPSWVWKFRTGENYTGSGEIKPLTWIVVAKDHYEGLGSHVTLLSEKLICLYTFDNSSDRDAGFSVGSNHWGDSGTTDAEYGLRPWLNSAGIHSADGFHKGFSDDFQDTVMITPLPNKDWEGRTYYTDDIVFIPSSTELGEKEHNLNYEIGRIFPYFEKALGAELQAELPGHGEEWYWTRSPSSSLDLAGLVRGVRSDGTIGGYSAGVVGGVRPALNLPSEILVSEIGD